MPVTTVAMLTAGGPAPCLSNATEAMTLAALDVLKEA